MQAQEKNVPDRPRYSGYGSGHLDDSLFVLLLIIFCPRIYSEWPVRGWRCNLHRKLEDASRAIGICLAGMRYKYT